MRLAVRRAMGARSRFVPESSLYWYEYVTKLFPACTHERREVSRHLGESVCCWLNQTKGGFVVRFSNGETILGTVRRFGRFFRSVPLALFLAAAATDGKAVDLDGLYRHAVADAAFAEKSEITKTLVSITRDNQNLVWSVDGSKILVVTWKARPAYEQFLKPYDKTSENPDYAVWVTAVPQVKRLCAALLAADPRISKEQVDLRLKQYLGLNPEWQYDVFVEMWVDPEDLFRPCVDPQVDDTTCNLQFGAEAPKVKNIANYRNFYTDLYYKSFRGSAGVPWTGLGYTYDWGNPESEIGASEYILAPGSPYQIRQAVPTMTYCRG